MNSNTLVNPNKLSAFVTAGYAKAGMPIEDAKTIADTLVQADLWGHQSHGVLRMPWYLERIRLGTMSPTTKIDTVRDHGAVAVLDGNEGVGQVIAKHAMTLAISKAKTHGMASVAVRNSNHFGTLMYFTRMATEQSCIAFLTSNGGPAMAPWGGAKTKLIGANPWSIAAPVSAISSSSAPAGKLAPMMLDMANTGVARGKIYLAKNRGERIPEGWAMDSDGRPTTDPEEAIKGLILPMAHHKGYAIATLMDVFAGVLSGSKFLDGVFSPYHYDKKSGAGHMFTVYDIEAFMPLQEFHARMAVFVGTIKANPKAEGVSEIFYPGEMEANASVRQAALGISLPVDTWNDLKRLASELDLNAELEACQMR
jgi:LDH2 family malate/lactate/ureidoglycolate dehydrogenase